MSTNFITPNELKQQQEKIARRKRMAELIRTSAATPIESPGVAGAKTSPWQVLIKALQGGIGGYEESQANKEEKALLARQDAAEKNANTEFAAEQYQYGRQNPVPTRSPDDITPTETFAVPDSLTPHQAPAMLPGADQAQYLASIAPTVKSQIPEQVPGREMPPPPPMQFGPPSQQRAAEFLDEMRRSPQPLGIPPGADQAQYLASSAPTVTSQIPEQVPGREMPPPPNYIQSLVAALGKNKKSNEYVDQRRLALANVLNSKDPNKIKFMLDQMGNREQFEQQRQLASEQADVNKDTAQLKYNRDVQMARDRGDLETLAYLQKNKDEILAASTLAGVNAARDKTLAGYATDAASKLVDVNKDTASALDKVHEQTAKILNERNVANKLTDTNAKIAAAKLVADAKSAQDNLLKIQKSDAFLKAPVAIQTAVVNNQGLMDDIEEAIAFLNDPSIEDSMSLASLAKKSVSNRLIPGNQVKIYSKLGLIASKQVLDMTGKTATEAENIRYRSFTPNISGGLLGFGADTKGSAITKLKQYYEALQRNMDVVGRTYNFKTTSARPQEVPPEIWWNYSQKDKNAYVPALPDEPTAAEWELLSPEDKATYRAMEKKK